MKLPSSLGVSLFLVATSLPATAVELAPPLPTLLQRMSDNLRLAETLEVRSEWFPGSPGEDIPGLGVAETVWVQRPNRLRIDRLGAGQQVNLWFNGRQLAIQDGVTQRYATGVLRGSLKQLVEGDAPVLPAIYGLFMSANPYAQLTAGLRSGRYNGLDRFSQNKLCYQLDLEWGDRRWRLWLDQLDALPCRVTLYQGNQAQATLVFRDWRRNYAKPFSFFEFQPPAGGTAVTVPALQPVLRPPGPGQSVPDTVPPVQQQPKR
jgi:hypothetical protein